MQMRRLSEKRFHNYFDNNPKVSNLMEVLKLPKGSDIYVTEAEFDRISTTLKNSIAMIGGTLSKNVEEILKDYNLILLPDADKVGYNEALKRAYYNKEKVLVNLEQVDTFKDFNTLLQEGMTKKTITDYVLENIKSSTRAVIELKRRGYKIYKD